MRHTTGSLRKKNSNHIPTHLSSGLQHWTRVKTSTHTLSYCTYLRRNGHTLRQTFHSSTFRDQSSDVKAHTYRPYPTIYAAYSPSL